MSDEPDNELDLDGLLDESTLTGDIRDVLLTHMRSWEDPWSKLSERQQEDKIRVCANLADDLVRRAVLLVSNRGLPHLIVEVGKITLDKGIKIDVNAANLIDNVHAIAEHGKRPAILVLASVAQFNGARSQPKGEPDQRSLTLGSEYTQGDGEGFDDPANEPDGLDDEPAADDENDDITDAPVADAPVADAARTPRASKRHVEAVN